MATPVLLILDSQQRLRLTLAGGEAAVRTTQPIRPPNQAAEATSSTTQMTPQT